MTIQFTVPGPPQGKARPRFFRRGQHVGTYTPAKTVDYENQVKYAFKIARNSLIIAPVFPDHTGPVSLSIIAYFEPPKSASKKTRAQMLAGELKPTKKPDADNSLKIIADSLNGVAWHDDAQITDATVSKRYGIPARVEVEIKYL